MRIRFRRETENKGYLDTLFYKLSLQCRISRVSVVQEVDRGGLLPGEWFHGRTGCQHPEQEVVLCYNWDILWETSDVFLQILHLRLRRFYREIFCTQLGARGSSSGEEGEATTARSEDNWHNDESPCYNGNPIFPSQSSAFRCPRTARPQSVAPRTLCKTASDCGLERRGRTSTSSSSTRARWAIRRRDSCTVMKSDTGKAHHVSSNVTRAWSFPHWKQSALSTLQKNLSNFFQFEAF